MKLQDISLSQAYAEMNELIEQYAPQTKLLFAVFIKKPVHRDFFEPTKGGTVNFLKALAEKVRLGERAEIKFEGERKIYALHLKTEIVGEQAREEVQSD